MSWAQCKRYNQLGGAAHSNDTVADGRADQACDLQDGLELSKLIKSLYSLCMIHTAPEVHMVIGTQVYHNMLASFGMQDTTMGGKLSVLWHALQGSTDWAVAI